MLSHHQGIYISEFAVLTLSLFVTKKRGGWSQLWKHRDSAKLEMWLKKENLITMNSIIIMNSSLGLTCSISLRKKRNVKSKLLSRFVI